MDSDTDLSTLVGKNDHWNVLKYIRIHKLRESELVLYHGSKILFTSSAAEVESGSNAAALQFSHQYQTTIGYYTILEQVCLAALDCHKFIIAECCLSELEKELHLNHSQEQIVTDNDAVVTDSSNTSIPLSSTSIRYQLLRGRYYEAIGEVEIAQQIYSTLLKHNPSNTIAAKRQYAVVKSQPNQELQSIESLNDYITTHSSFNDSSIFYELYIQYKNIGQYVYCIYCLQQVLYIMSTIRNADTVHMSLLHCELAECYITSVDDTAAATTTAATTASIETIRTARKHMTIALELNPMSLRAQFGLVVIANRYLLYTEQVAETSNSTSSTSKSNNGKSSASDDRLSSLAHEINVSKELIRYSTEQIIETTTNRSSTLCTKSMQLSIQALLDEYTDGL
jgi:tetratricopeptide (TPR) repeat protein